MLGKENIRVTAADKIINDSIKAMSVPLLSIIEEKRPNRPMSSKYDHKIKQPGIKRKGEFVNILFGNFL